MAKDKHPLFAQIAARIKGYREHARLDPATVEARLLFGPGWIHRFESGETIPAIDILFALLKTYGRTPAELFADIAVDALPVEIHRAIYATQDGDSLRIHFTYAKHDATYVMPNATVAQFDTVIRVLRDGLARLVNPKTEGEAAAVQTDSVARMFLKAVEVWPHANPSDMWWFFVSRAYCDPFNHPAKHARLDLGQSWKRTGGWALEEIMVRHYAPFLKANGVALFIAPGADKPKLLSMMSANARLEADKVDVFLAGIVKDKLIPFGVVHVKASFAERRTDDVPMSQALIAHGYTSPLWTMDCKGGPSEKPENDGELGVTKAAKGPDGRSAKRKDIEDDGFFSACFSYNSRTAPTPPAQNAKANVIVCNFANPDDAFSRFVLGAWKAFSQRAPTKS